MSHDQQAELLAPAGNVEAFYGAIHAGADAVYLAGNKFGARAYAENFETQELVRCIRYAHLSGRKVYLTVNTLLKESEFDGLYEYMRPFCEEGLDAVIVQDLGVLRFIREHFPDCGLHASTQMTLCGSWGAALLKDMGAGRIVPARELSLRELIAVKQNTGMEIEAFVHGAMCYCYSGQCLFSSVLGGRSGNRGRCAQPCRLPYSVILDKAGTEECYPLSLKDMCTIEHIPKLIEAGIDSFKIEGRMKKPAYAAGVTGIYRKYMDRYYELREQKGPEDAAEAYGVEGRDRKRLSTLYIRSELQDGYYFKQNGRDMITLSSPSYNGNDERLLTEIQEQYLENPLKLPVSMEADFRTGQNACLTLIQGGVRVSVTGALVEKALKQPVTKETIKKQLSRLGESAFYPEKIEIVAGEDCFYPLKQINELRREAVARLEEEILLARGYGKRECRPQRPVGKAAPSEEERERTTACVLYVRTIPQLEAVAEEFGTILKTEFLRLYVEGDLLMQEWETVSALCGGICASGGIYAALPYIVRESGRPYLERLYQKVKESKLFRGFLVRSLDGLGFVREKDERILCRADAGLYVWNQSAMAELGDVLEGFCLPYELKASEQKTILGSLSCEKIVYGRIPMMITANCLRKTVGKCHKSALPQDTVTLEDRYRKRFPVLINCGQCMNVIYNCVPLSLHNELSKWKGKVDLRLDFIFESSAEVKRILTSLRRGTPFVQGEYTTGHEKRGVE